MPVYMSQFCYTAEAAAAMVKQPQDRSIVLRQAVEKLGGRLIAFYYCFGEYDGVAIAELPDQVTALAHLLAVKLAGHVKSMKTTVLLTMDESVAAMKKAGGMVYRGPDE